MKALKGLMIYIGIVLGCLVGLGLILLCLMYFIPSFRIAGYGIVHYQTNTEVETIVLEDYEDYSKIELNINSNNLNIQVLPKEIDDIEYKMHLSVFGVSSEIVEYKINKFVEVREDKLHIFLNVSEPNGWISASDSIVYVYVPTNKKMALITNTRSGNIDIGNNDHSINLSDFLATTTSGDLKLTNVGSGTTEKSLSLETMNLSTETGMFDLASIDNITVYSKVNISAKDGDFRFKNIYASLVIKGSGVRIDADKITCGENGFSFIAENGYFNIKELSCPIGAENTIITENASIKIDNIEGKTGIVTNYGSVNIGDLHGYTIIENENGNVTIDKAYDEITVNTNMGNISVNEYYKSGWFASNRGNIEVSSVSDYVKEYHTTISNVDGNIKVYNKINLLKVDTTGRSKVEVTFGQVKTGMELGEAFQHSVKIKAGGSGIIWMPQLSGDDCYKFVAKGNISGDIGSIEIEASNSDQYYPNENYKAQTIYNASFYFEGTIVFKSYPTLAA